MLYNTCVYCIRTCDEKGIGEEKKKWHFYLLCIATATFSAHKRTGQKDKKSSPSVIIRAQYDVREIVICHCIGGGGGKVLSCPKRYRSVESRHVFCTRRPGSIPAGIASGTVRSQCEGQKKKRRKYKYKIKRFRAHTTRVYSRTRTFTPAAFNWPLSRVFAAAWPVNILIYLRGVKRNRRVFMIRTQVCRACVYSGIDRDVPEPICGIFVEFVLRVYIYTRGRCGVHVTVNTVNRTWEMSRIRQKSRARDGRVRIRTRRPRWSDRLIDEDRRRRDVLMMFSYIFFVYIVSKRADVSPPPTDVSTRTQQTLRLRRIQVVTFRVTRIL